MKDHPDSLQGPSARTKTNRRGDVERWLAAIVESSDDAIIGKTPEGVITSWNAGAEHMFGYRAEEVLGKAITILIPRELWREEADILARLRDGGRIDHFETVRIRKDGSKIFISLTISPIRDTEGRITGVSKIARDITEYKSLKEREEQARAAMLGERRFRELIENAPDAILLVDASGTISIANRTAESMFGYSPEDLMGQNVDLLVPGPSRGHHAEYRNAFVDAGVSRPMGQGLELYACRKDGSEFPVEISLSPMQTNAGTSVAAVIRDVTERKRAEQQIRFLRESYMTELEASQQKAERLNQLKSEFMASMSHELRTPLHTIIGFAELLAEERDGPLNERQKRFLDHIRVDSEHLLELINDVLDLSRIEAGGLKLQSVPLLTSEAIDEAVDAVLLIAAKKSVAIRAEKTDSISIVADPLRLRQILYNLLNNAVKFTPSGGEVVVGAVRDGDFVRFTVADTGIGIPKDEHERIFDKFYQMGTTTEGVRQGTGLGLAICRQLVEMQGGSIWVESDIGKGSRFSFTIPNSRR